MLNAILHSLMKISIVLLLIVALVVYIGVVESRAEKKAKDFCSGIKVGASTSGLIENALNAGAAPMHLHWVKKSDGGREQYLMAMFTGLPPFSRHFCDIEATDQLIVSATYSYLD